MSYSNFTFDNLHSLDNAQVSLIFDNPKAYNHYTGNLSAHYSDGSSSSNSSNSWDLLKSHLNGFNCSVQPRSANLSMSHPAQSSEYTDSSYLSYITPSASYMLYEPQHTFPSSQVSYRSLGLKQPGSGHQSMLQPVLTEIPNHQAPDSAPASVSRGRGVTLSGPQTKRADILPEASLSAYGQCTGFNFFWDDTFSLMTSPDTDTPYDYSLEVSSVALPDPHSAAAFAVCVSTSSSIPPEPRRANTDSPASIGKSCSHCHATSTPLWRRERNTLKSLCNACGLYLSQWNKHRPQELIDADGDDLETSDGAASGPECSHCHTHHTSVWRRSKTGAQLCNACGVYSRLRGKDRPLSLKRNKIKPRSKHNAPKPTTLS